MESLYTGDGAFVPESMENLQKTVKRFKESFKPLSESLEKYQTSMETHNLKMGRISESWANALQNLAFPKGIATLQLKIGDIDSALKLIALPELKFPIVDFQKALQGISSRVFDHIHSYDLELIEYEDLTESEDDKAVLKRRRLAKLKDSFQAIKKEIKHMLKKDGLAKPIQSKFIDWYITERIKNKIADGELPPFLDDEDFPEITYSDFEEYTEYLRGAGKNSLAKQSQPKQLLQSFNDFVGCLKSSQHLDELVRSLRYFEKINEDGSWLGQKNELGLVAEALLARNYLKPGAPISDERLVPLIATHFKITIAARTTRERPMNSKFKTSLIAKLPPLP